MATANKLELVFNTALEKVYTIHVYEADTTLVADDVFDVMEGVITANIFRHSGGELVSIKSASLETKTPFEQTA